MPDNLLTTADLAERLKVSLQTLQRWRTLEDLNGLPYVMVGDQIRYRPSDVEAWLKSRTIGA